jgi:hypothetical protein
MRPDFEATLNLDIFDLISARAKFSGIWAA